MMLGLLVASENMTTHANRHTRFMFYKYRYILSPLDQFYVLCILNLDSVSYIVARKSYLIAVRIIKLVFKEQIGKLDFLSEVQSVGSQ